MLGSLGWIAALMHHICPAMSSFLCICVGDSLVSSIGGVCLEATGNHTANRSFQGGSPRKYRVDDLCSYHILNL